jgi:xylulokinase
MSGKCVVMLLLGIDLGTSSTKVSVVDAASRRCLATVQYPETEASILVPVAGWAEQSPDLWWEHVTQAILKCHATKAYDPSQIGAIGISYQMHGLVLVDDAGSVLRNAIIWCDGRAVETGDAAFTAIGADHCLSHLLNSPGNFTASKLAWVKANEPGLYAKVDKVLLPGDFIAMKLTGEATTTSSALSEGIFWDFQQAGLSPEIMSYFGFDKKLIPSLAPVFSTHGHLRTSVAGDLKLPAGIPVSYKAGDQLNNAFSLNVLQPGEVAATAGTSGVIYGVTDRLATDPLSRVNSFVHVSHTPAAPRVGVLLCINGAGIFNRWIRDGFGAGRSYERLNAEAAAVAAGADGLRMLPFGNGAERMLENHIVGAHLHNLDLNIHSTGHLVRAAQEGIAFSFRYGLDIMRENGMNPTVIRAGRANLFLSNVFAEAFVNATGVPVELYETDGSRGAAVGAGVGAGLFAMDEAASSKSCLCTIEPTTRSESDGLYREWKAVLEMKMHALRARKFPV